MCAESRVPHSAITLIANQKPAEKLETDTEHTAKDAGVGATAGAVLGGGAGLLAGIGMVSIPGIGSSGAMGLPSQ